MIKVSNLSKSYGEIDAVKNISFNIKKGEILGFLGPNGAGKSTTMNMLTGLLLPTSGRITINGLDIFENPHEAKKHIGYLPEKPPLYMNFTVYEHLKFVCELKEIKKEEINSEIDRVCELLNILDVKKRVIKNLSKGYRQRVGISAALIGTPEIIVLDEPTVGLDPNQIVEIRKIIKTLAKKHTIILSTHILPEVNALCSKVIIMDKGEIKAKDTTENLSKDFSKTDILNIQIEGAKTKALKAFKEIEGIKHIDVFKDDKPKVYNFKIEVEKNNDLRKEVFSKLAENGLPILSMNIEKLSLEDIFSKITLKEDGSTEKAKVINIKTKKLEKGENNDEDSDNI